MYNKSMEDKIMLPIVSKSFPSLVDEFFNNGFYDDHRLMNGTRNVPKVNISENKNEFKIDVAAPGASKNDFNIEVHKNTLTISAEKENKVENNDEKVLRTEFNYSSFKRSFNLPDSVNNEKISANYKDGVLYVTIPKKEEAIDHGPRVIKIS